MNIKAEFSLKKQKKFKLSLSNNKMTNHLIQIVGLRDKNNTPKLDTIGLVSIDDRNCVVFNPSIKGSKKVHWTLHKDGYQHIKDNNGRILCPTKRIPLEKLKQGFQFLFSSISLESALSNFEYKPRGNQEYGLFLVDLTKFKKGVGISIHISDTNHVNKCTKAFDNKPEHQCFIYWKSKPKLIIHIFDN